MRRPLRRTRSAVPSCPIADVAETDRRAVQGCRGFEHESDSLWALRLASLAESPTARRDASRGMRGTRESPVTRWPRTSIDLAGHLRPRAAAQVQALARGDPRRRARGDPRHRRASPAPARPCSACSLLGLLPDDPAPAVDRRGRRARGPTCFGLRRSPSAAVRRRSDLGAVFQDPATSLNPTMTDRPTDRGGGGTRPHGSSQLLDRGRDPRATRSGSGHFPHELSGGQQQRVMIAMAIAKRPGARRGRRTDDRARRHRAVRASSSSSLASATIVGCSFVLRHPRPRVSPRRSPTVSRCSTRGGSWKSGPPTDVLHRACTPVHDRIARLSGFSSRSPRDRPVVTPSRRCSRPRARAATGLPLRPALPPRDRRVHGAADRSRSRSADRAGSAACIRLAEAVRLRRPPQQWPAPSDRAEMSSDGVVVEVRGLTKSLRARRSPARGHDAALRRRRPRSSRAGESVALVGESGSGKTTLLRILAGLETAGRVAFSTVRDPDATDGLPERARVADPVAHRPGPGRRAAAPSRPQPKGGRSQPSMRRSRGLGWRRTIGAATAPQLSGGQAQRVAIARAIVDAARSAARGRADQLPRHLASRRRAQPAESAPSRARSRHGLRDARLWPPLAIDRRPHRGRCTSGRDRRAPATLRCRSAADPQDAYTELACWRRVRRVPHALRAAQDDLTRDVDAEPADCRRRSSSAGAIRAAAGARRIDSITVGRFGCSCSILVGDRRSGAARSRRTIRSAIAGPPLTPPGASSSWLGTDHIGHDIFVARGLRHCRSSLLGALRRHHVRDRHRGADRPRRRARSEDGRLPSSMRTDRRLPRAAGAAARDRGGCRDRPGLRPHADRGRDRLVALVRTDRPGRDHARSGIDRSSEAASLAEIAASAAVVPAPPAGRGPRGPGRREPRRRRLDLDPRRPVVPRAGRARACAGARRDVGARPALPSVELVGPGRCPRRPSR